MKIHFMHIRKESNYSVSGKVLNRCEGKEMALRKMRIMGEDECLREVCREVKNVTPKITQLIDDMLDTMYDQGGVGLAAPQIGILKRIVVIDVGEGPIVMINPKILETEGTQTGSEGCLSVPGKNGTVTRPMYVKAEFYGEDMEKYIIEGEELLARAICHELDHLDGKLYVDFVEGKLRDNEIDGYGEEKESEE